MPETDRPQWPRESWIRDKAWEGKEWEEQLRRPSQPGQHSPCTRGCWVNANCRGRREPPLEQRERLTAWGWEAQEQKTSSWGNEPKES